MNARNFQPIVPDSPEPRAPLNWIPNFGHAAADDVAEYVAVSFARIDRMSDDELEAAIESEVEAASAEELEDVRHDMRTSWQEAIDGQHALSTPKLPTVDGKRLVMVPVTELVGTLMETQWSVQLLADALRTGDTTKLHLHLRTMWIDGYSDELARMGWKA